MPAAARYVLRSVAWRVQLAYVILAVGVIVHGRIVETAPWAYEARLRVATALVAAGAGLVLDDDATRTIEASPRHRRVAVTARTLTILGVATFGWITCVVAVPGNLPATVVRAFCVQAVAWILAGLLTARLLGSSAVTVSLLTAAIAVQFLPTRWTMVTTPDAANWHDTQTRWLIVAAVVTAAVGFVFRDPAAPSLRMVLAPHRDRRRVSSREPR